MKKEFEVTVAEKPKYYLGMEILQKEDGVVLKQTNYAKKVAKKYGMENSRATSTPLSKVEPINKEEIEEKTFPYREAVGSLLYASCKTRPDLSFAVNYESRRVTDPTIEDVTNVKRTLRYLNGTQQLGIQYTSRKKEDLLKLEVYCDSDFAGDKIDKKSTTGFVMMYGNGPIMWNAKKQKIVATSSTEAEYVAAAQCCAQMKYIKTVIEELIDKQINVTLHLDNQSAIRMIKSGQMSINSHHIEIKYHFISDELNRGWFNLKYCPSQDQLADVFTKPLPRVKFQEFRDRLLTA